METISNVAAAASKAIFGETKTTNETGGQEPVSGEQGRGTPNEPFDKGNSEDPVTGDNSAQAHMTPVSESTSTTHNETGGQEPISGSQGAGTLTEPFDKGNSDKPLTGDKSTSAIGDHTTSLTAHNSSSLTGPDATSGTDNTSTSLVGDSKESDKSLREPSTVPSSTTKTPNHPDNAATATQGGSDPLTSTDKTGVILGSNPPKGHDVVPTERSTNPGAAPDSGAAPETKQQGADKPSSVPTGSEETAIKDKKDDAEDILKNRDPNDHSGEPMHMHDGPEKVPSTQEERRTSKAGNPGGQEHGKDPKGTGDQWVKSSGMAADGGDFDATKPGAGREADRLLEQKGIHKSEGGGFETAPAAESSTADPGEHKEKEKLTDRLKNKLHIGHKHKESK